MEMHFTRCKIRVVRYCKDVECVVNLAYKPSVLLIFELHIRLAELCINWSSKYVLESM